MSHTCVADNTIPIFAFDNFSKNDCSQYTEIDVNTESFCYQYIKHSNTRNNAAYNKMFAQKIAQKIISKFSNPKTTDLLNHLKNVNILEPKIQLLISLEILDVTQNLLISEPFYIGFFKTFKLKHYELTPDYLETFLEKKSNYHKLIRYYHQTVVESMDLVLKDPALTNNVLLNKKLIPKFKKVCRLTHKYHKKFAQFASARKTYINIETPKYIDACLLYTSPSPRDRTRSRMPSSA